MSDILWLASFPKSGNTWIKNILASMAAGGEVVDINKATVSATCTQKDLARQFLGEPVPDSEYFSSKRIEIFKRMVKTSKGYNLVVKTHCCHVAIGGQPLILNKLSQGCILII